MKLDKDLVRNLLLQIEAKPDPIGLIEITVAGHPREEVAYHIQILDEAGFIKAEDLSSYDGYDWRAERLTFDGHEFLDTVRDAKIWRRTKEIAKSTGVASVKALFEIGKSVAKQSLIAHGIDL